MRLRLAACAAIFLFASLAGAEQPAAPSALMDRVGNTGFVLLHAESFKALDPKQQALAYWLTQASIAIDPIIYDQLSPYGLRQKRLLEEIVAHPEGIDPAAMGKITDFAKLFWANRGNHNENTAQKFLPTFTFDELKQAAVTAQRHGAMKTAYGDLPPLPTPAQLNRELDGLRASLFDPSFQPMTTAKSPQGGKDIIQASSNNFYSGVSLAELKDFKDQHPLNSRLVKGKDGKLHEEVYRAGTPDGRIPPGLYATYLRRANQCLEKARAAAEPKQAQVIADLIRFYQTGDFQDWLKFGADWVQDNSPVDFANGFIEIYRDARGAKGSSQSFVSVTDKPLTDAMVKLAENAQYFEQRAPWDDKYKKIGVQPPVVKAVETLIETGDFQVTTIGDNLPNENEIREKYGSKNFLFTGSSRALNDAGGFKSLEEFAATPEQIERGKKYGNEAEDLMTAMHEVIGHGSGKLSDRLKGGSEPYLKEYFSAMEEARADLMALWNAWDPKLKELGLVSEQDEVAKAMYDRQTLAALVQLRRIPKGDTIEEDHARDRQLIARYIQDKVPGSIEQFDRNGKTYIRVKDYHKMHEGVGMLLAEIMRIKAEGDYDAIKALTERYAVHFDPALRDQMVARYKQLNIPTYWAGIYSSLDAAFDAKGNVKSVAIEYPHDVARQYLGYAAMYDKGLARQFSVRGGNSAAKEHH
ncbi:MAG: dipeptidyl-peptidase 3 family protein [Terriglobales bacterium]